VSRLLREDRAGAAILTINRPEKLNALDVAFFIELRAEVERLAQQTETVGLVVLRGAGRCFSAGHDLDDIAAGERLPEPHFQARTIQRLAELPQTVICAVHGHCYTGALELALAADVILAADSARFADTHARFSLTPVWGMSQRLPRRIGEAKALEMMLTARTCGAAEALAMGLVNACAPDAEFDALVERWTAEILANAWFSLRAIKRLAHDTDGLGLDAGLAHEAYATAGRGPDMADRIAAFKARRGDKKG
jgi:enoyl-CoA hydratase